MNRTWINNLAIASLAIGLMACERAQPTQVIDHSIKMQSFGNLTPRCVGRYLFELPEQFVLNTEGGQVIDGVSLIVKSTTHDQFTSLLAKRTRILEKSFTLGINEKYPMLKRVIPLPNGANGAVFDRAESEVTGGRLSRILELMAWREGYAITATIRATDTTFPEDKDDGIAQKHLKTDVPEKLDSLLSVFARTKGRAEGEIPDQQGVCILNGFVSGPPSPQESVTIFYHLASANDVYFRVSTSSLDAGDDTVLDRVKDIEPLLAGGKGKILRKARRDTNGMDANEIAYSVLSDEDLEKRQIMTYVYVFEANSKKGSAKYPILSVDFLSGQRKPEPEKVTEREVAPILSATLNESDSSSLWDLAVPTFRPSPKAF